MSIPVAYRLGCQQTSSAVPTPKLGGCFQFFTNTTGSIPILKNVTQMRSISTLGAYDTPYAMAQPLQPTCGEYNDYTCPDRTAPDNTVFCGPPSASDIRTSVSLPTQSFSTGLGIYNNAYVLTTQSISINGCTEKIGFRNVYAAKEWHGRVGYNSKNWQTTDNFAWCGDCNWSSYNPTPDNTKYLALDATANRYKKVITSTNNGYFDGSTCCDGQVDNYINDWEVQSTVINTSTATNNVKVDKYSGNLTVTLAVSGATGPTASPDDAWDDLVTYANSNIGDLYNAWLYNVIHLCDGTPDYHDNSNNGVHEIKCYTTQSLHDACGNIIDTIYPLVVHMNVDMNAGTFTLIQYAQNKSACNSAPTCTTCNQPYDDVTTTTFTIGATIYDFSYSSHTHPSHSVEIVENNSVSSTLSSLYTGDDVQSDIVKLLSKIPLDNDKILKWRTDSFTNVGPLVSYDEAYSQPVISRASNGTLSGKILGEPGPVGLDRVWMPAHNNYAICTDENGVQCAYVNSYGAYNNEYIDAGGSITQITDGLLGNSFPQGAFISNRVLSTIPCSSGESVGPNVSTRLFAGKWAEIIFPKESFNYARPCGADRFAVNSNSASCISSISDHTLTLNNPTKITTGQYCYVGGTGDDSLDGCWQVDVINPTGITLVNSVISASLVGTQPLNNFGSGMIIPLQFQTNNQLNPSPICGYLDIVSCNNTNPITMSVATPHYLVDGDNVGIAYHNALPNNVYGVKVVTSQSFALPTIDATSFPTYNGKAIVYSPFGAAFGWNDTDSKGDFTVLEWDYGYRDYGEYLRISASIAYYSGSLKCAVGPELCGTIPPVPEPRTNQKNCYDQIFSLVSCTTKCVPVDACNGRVAFCSPNSETFGAPLIPTGSTTSSLGGGGSVSILVSSGSISGSVTSSVVNNIGWFPKFTLDSLYGSTYIKTIKQSMIDPYYIAPAAPCGIDSWHQDNGACVYDNNTGYPYPPYYEARCEVPKNAPPLLPNHYLGCVKNTNPIIQTDISCSKGNYCLPPVYNTDNIYANGDGVYVYGTPVYTAPWVAYLHEEYCVCNTGSFYKTYQDYGVICKNPYVPAP